jgi:hypothetical protein
LDLCIEYGWQILTEVVGRDSKFSGSMDKSSYENYSAGDIRIKELEDECVYAGWFL